MLRRYPISDTNYTVDLSLQTNHLRIWKLKKSHDAQHPLCVEHLCCYPPAIWQLNILCHVWSIMWFNHTTASLLLCKYKSDTHCGPNVTQPVTSQIPTIDNEQLALKDKCRASFTPQISINYSDCKQWGIIEKHFKHTKALKNCLRVKAWMHPNP